MASRWVTAKAANFVPFGVMTYWQGENGYEMEAEYIDPTQMPAPVHTKYTFNLEDAVDVYVWDDWAGPPQVFLEATSIIVHEPTDVGHDDIHQSPIGSGGPGVVEPMP